MVLDGYVRVSQVAGRSGEGFISQAVQREQIKHWVTARGYVLGEVYSKDGPEGGYPVERAQSLGDGNSGKTRPCSPGASSASTPRSSMRYLDPAVEACSWWCEDVA